MKPTTEKTDFSEHLKQGYRYIVLIREYGCYEYKTFKSKATADHYNERKLGYYGDVLTIRRAARIHHFITLNNICS